MPPANKKPTPQAERFAEAVRALEKAGELNPAEANERFERAFKRIAPAKKRAP